MSTTTPTIIEYFDAFGEGTNEYAFLSNFYQGRPLRIGTRTYATGEHAFQAYKATNLFAHNNIRLAETPNDAKRRGRQVALRPDWEAIKYDVMRLVLATKFTMSRDEGQMLLDTGEALLVEGNHWNDRVWGVSLKNTVKRRLRGESWHPGRNWLGHLLMARRAELRAYGLGAQQYSHSDVQAFVNRGLEA